MPADNDTNDNTPTQSGKVGWRRAHQQTYFRRLSPDELRQYELKAELTPFHTVDDDKEDDEDVSDRAAIFELRASHYYPRQIETTSPKGAERRGEAASIVDAAEAYLEALDGASDSTLDDVDNLDGEVGASHRAVTKTQTAAAQLIGPAPAGRPSHEHLDDFVYELVTMIEDHYDVEFKVYFTDAGQPITAVSVFLWRLVKHFDPNVNEESLRTAMRRAKQRPGKVN